MEMYREILFIIKFTKLEYACNIPRMNEIAYGRIVYNIGRKGIINYRDFLKSDQPKSGKEEN